MFSMTDGAPERAPDADPVAVLENDWPRIEADLAAVDARVRSLVGRDRVDELAVRRARRAGRRVLHPARLTPATWGGDAA